ncbi:hypothetical protein [Methylobacterium sp. Leaf466]|uniref:hypothetical protein n=1 Tax=Methylobacterium sp. Leaf466 TaxID=1736386 RepID=UPI003242A575
MKPMEPMKPMQGSEAWWPQELGRPSTSGGQNDLRYAFFPDKQRLVIEENGKRTTYDSGDHQINGVSQSSGGSPRFRSQNGEVALDQLKTVD